MTEGSLPISKVALDEVCVKTLVEEIWSHLKLHGDELSKETIHPPSSDLNEISENASRSFNNEIRESLHSKEKEEEKKMARIERLTKSLQAQEKEESNIDKSDLLAALGKGDWKSVDELFQESEIENIEKMTLLLNLAIIRNAKSDRVLFYAQQGGVLADNALLMLMREDRADLAKELIEFGLNTNVQGNTGYTPIHQAVFTEALGILKLLIDLGTDVNSYDGALDPLDMALQGFSLNGPSSQIVDLLITNGARIEQSHVEIVNEMVHLKLDEHLYLINRYPLLQK